ncbi:hypothetical protein BH23ACT8_BH23ACT8_25410 [soil metagenome]
MVRVATTEQVAAALHVGPAAVRKYARQDRIPFLTTPGGHRRYDIDEVRRALGVDDGAAAPFSGGLDVEVEEQLAAADVATRRAEATVTVTAVRRPSPTLAADRDEWEAWTSGTALA